MSKTASLVGFVALLVSACGPTSRPRTGPQATGSSCEAAAERYTSWQITQTSQGDAPAEVIEILERGFTRVCVDSLWSEETRNCFGHLYSQHAGNGDSCVATMTQDQIRATSEMGAALAGDMRARAAEAEQRLREAEAEAARPQRGE